MSERIPESKESLPKVEAGEALAQPKSPEKQAELVEADKKQRKEHLEAAREVLEKQPEPAAAPAEKEKAAPPPTKFDKDRAYAETMASVRRRLSPVSRSFSKVIHAPAIEKTSEVIGATIARPSVTTGATVTAAIVGGFLYYMARTYGFSLSGSEILLSLVVGGVLGFLIELVARAFGRRPS